MCMLGCPLIPEYLTEKRPAFYLDFDNRNPDQWHNNPEVDYYDGSVSLLISHEMCAIE